MSEITLVENSNGQLETSISSLSNDQSIILNTKEKYVDKDIKINISGTEGIYFIVGNNSDTTPGLWTGTDSRITEYYNGLTIIYTPVVAGSSTTTLNINGLGAKTCYYTGATKLTTHYPVGTPILFTYYNDGWRRADYGSQTPYTSATCTTNASTAAKYANCTYYNLTPNTYTQVIMYHDNTVQGAITLDINGKGAKPIYINGVASSSSNYTLPKGSYIVFYNGANYNFRTDGKIPGSITGTANSAAKLDSSAGSATQPIYFSDGKPVVCAYELNKSVPSDAKFTDTNTKVTQNAITASEYTNWRPLVIGSSNSGTEGFNPATVTDTTITSNTLSCQPSSGTIKATTFKGRLTGTADKAIQDGSGNNIVVTYATKAELNNQTNTALTNAKSYADTKVAGLVDSAPETLDTLNELAKALGDDSNFATTVANQIGTKSDKGHTHYYASSDSIGGSANSAVKLDSSAGDYNTPVYFSDGKPVSCTSLDLNTTGNAATATQLETVRTIELGTGAIGTATNFDGTSNITIPVTSLKEAYLDWGDIGRKGSVTPLGAALSSEHSANRLAYLNPDAIKVEYSNDAGSSWDDYTISNEDKIGFVTTSSSIDVGNSAIVTTSHRTRITITAQDGTNGYVYTRPRKMLLNVSTFGHEMEVLVETKIGVNGAKWQTIGTYELSGQSEWNDIPLNLPTLGGDKTEINNIWYMRLTFATTAVSSNQATNKSTILGMRLFGDACWTKTSNMGETGHLYAYDVAQNATFPADVNISKKLVVTENVTAEQFEGPLKGNADSATQLTSSAGSATQPIYFKDGKPTITTVDNNVIFNEDGSITENYIDGTSKITVFNDDGSIVSTHYKNNIVDLIETTVFNEDDTISTTYVKGDNA